MLRVLTAVEEASSETSAGRVIDLGYPLALLAREWMMLRVAPVGR